ncbi:signal peptidase II [Streptococcus dysgalactiae]|uniref:Lipoprotein signal peptidase n=1 Tax=Streptococcus dysgalactiae TaxID=1334 RepID=A0A9X9SIP2_STRDY|nr:signal peptidase II [Streptococcus dysgalactiae]MDY2964431.1 signal peptidase II [Streptococcus dysgalactiae]MDY4034235.1 signal peptidase II [Streptococcus dysgalactiae]MEC4577115.1 signal peptidase II [Streptococcus dysgalactiae]QGH03090.1 signal peptidase II [Streptococcus dysgalactiae subsp. dysgalactiae]QZT28008.1 signal peptidase II [Streptococcus dysgalactiae]
MKKLLFVLSSIFLIGLDQFSKYWIVSHIELGQIKPFIPGIVSLTYLQNNGAAFSMLQNQQWFFVIMTILVIGYAIYYVMTHRQLTIWKQLALLLIISGGIGNFIDRLRLSYVIDMVHLDIIDFAIFNVADAYLTLGVILLVVCLWKEEDYGN